MSEHFRPYDPNQLSRLVEHVQDNGPVISPPELKEVSEVPTHPLDPRQVSLRGVDGAIKNRMSRQGKIERLQHRVNVARAAAELLDSAGNRGQDILGDDVEHAKKRIGWEGIYQSSWPDGKQRVDPNDLTQMGKQLLGKRSASTGKSPNPFRPETLSQKFAVKRLSYLIDKRRSHVNKAEWRAEGLVTSDTTTLREKLRNQSTSRYERRHIKKAIKAQEKFDKIAAGQNFAFKIGRKRLDSLRKTEMRERRKAREEAGLPELTNEYLGPVPEHERNTVPSPYEVTPFSYEWTPPEPPAHRPRRGERTHVDAPQQPEQTEQPEDPEMSGILMSVDADVNREIARRSREEWPKDMTKEDRKARQNEVRAEIYRIVWGSDLSDDEIATIFARIRKIARDDQSK